MKTAMLQKQLVDRPIRFASFARYFPGEPISNKYFEEIESLGIDDQWIRRHTGIRTRHWPADESERAVEMATKAVKRALEKANLAPDEVDLVIGTSSTTRPGINPSSAENRYMDISLPLQAAAGLTNAACFDVSAVACAGFIYGSALAASMMMSMGYKNVLVVCAENPKPILSFDYKYSALFGAGAAAALLRPAVDGEQGLVDFVLHSDGRHYGAFDIDDAGKMLMHGKHVGTVGPQKLISAGEELIQRNQLSLEDIDWFLPHQGNLNMINQVRDALTIPDSKVLTNIEYRGNTSSVSIPSCLSEKIDSGVVQSGDLIAAITIGRGFNWGALLVRV
jgi:hypothetical protein